MAAQSDHADTAKLLLKKGSPPDDVTMVSSTVLNFRIALFISPFKKLPRLHEIWLENLLENP